MPNILDDTQTFMEKGHHLDVWGLDEITADERKLRMTLMREEVKEYLDAEELDDRVEMADGLGDIIVIAYGSLLKYFGPERAKAVLDEIARSNLDKVEGPGLPLLREDGKILKPAGWRPPDVAGALGL